jgi:hypothetical protein
VIAGEGVRSHRKFCSREQLRNFVHVNNIIKTMRVRWARHAARMGTEECLQTSGGNDGKKEITMNNKT